MKEKLFEGSEELKPRVVVTGYGVVTPIGNNVTDFWNSLLNGKSGAGKILSFNTKEFATKIAAEVRGIKKEENLDGFAQFALSAALEAWRNSGLESYQIDPYRVGVLVGSSNGGEQYVQDNYLAYIKHGIKEIDANKFVGSMINYVPAMLAKRFGVQGVSYALSTACATGVNTVGESVRIIQDGIADVMVAGGTEDGIKELNVAGLARINAMTRRNEEPTMASRPFDRDRDGFLLGAGAGIIILESLEHAQKRNAPIYAEIVGYGCNTDSYHITAPNPEGIMPALAMHQALDEANIAPNEIDYINAHGTGTIYNDIMENNAIHRAFGEYGKRVPINAIKSLTGHMLGASGTVEIISTILSMQHNIIPRTVNCDHLDEEVSLNIIREENFNCVIDVAMSNSFGFGGNNVSIVLKKYDMNGENA